jgi:antitoxin HicB
MADLGYANMLRELSIVLTPQPEGGFTITSPLVPELITEGETVEESLANVKDAFEVVVEAYQDLGRPLPPNLQISDTASPIWLEALIAS